MKLLDFHSHDPDHKYECVRSFDITQDKLKVEESSYFTLGVHPWFLKPDSVVKLEQALPLFLKNPKFLGLGEIGLDRKRGAPIEQQKVVLEQCLHLAKKFKVKNVIFHSVKSHQDLIELRVTDSFVCAIHDYYGAEQMTKQLVEKNFYFSLGSILDSQIEKHLFVAKSIPLDRVFIESDDSPAMLAKRYQSLSDLHQLDVAELLAQIKKNFKLFTKSVLE